MTIIKYLRYLLRIPQPKISKDKAIARAKEECKQKGFKWEEPVRFEETLTRYKILTNSNARGNNIIIIMNSINGDIIKIGVIPR